MSDLTGKRILVTGGAGFIGSNLANELARDNEVVVIDDGYLGIPENLDDTVRYEERSVLDDNLPTDVDVVFHLAALSSYAMHEQDPTEGVRVNVEGFVNTVEQARDEGCDTVVYASTSSIYGDRRNPTPEGIDVSVNTGYEASKLSRERYAEYFTNHYGMNAAGMRLFSVYQGYEGNEEHKAEFANVIAQFADDIVHGRSPTLYGDGTQTRDFTHVDDVVRALITAADHQLTGIYNVGTGRSTSFKQIVEMLNKVLGTEIEPQYVENPIPDDVYVHDTRADYTKLYNKTGWEPTITIETGLKRVCAKYDQDRIPTDTLSKGDQ